MKKNIFLVFFLTFSIFKVYSQISENKYIPDEIDSLKTYLKRINSNQIKSIEGSFSSKIKKVYKDRDEKVIESINDSVYYFSHEISSNLSNILNNIYKSNPNQINSKDYGFFIKNSIIPNAGCYGDGMFEVNLGLFTTLNCDDELAFVLCHEIAHFILEHSIKNVTNVVSTINSKETKSKIKEIKKNEYGQFRAALAVIDELNIDILDYSKEVEAEADSIGYLMFAKTNYNKSSALTSLNKLKKIDDMILHHDVRLDSVFNFQNYPFKKYWLKEEVPIFDSEEEINEFKLTSDTVKTHPEIEFRVSKLIKDFNIQNETSSVSNTFLPAIQEISHLQNIQYSLDMKLLDFAIYQLILNFNDNNITPDYYYSKMSQLLLKIYQAKKNHKLGKYVPQKSNFSKEKNLNNIRLFIHNLELSEIKKIGLAFCEENKDNLKQTKEFTESHEFFKSINKYK